MKTWKKVTLVNVGCLLGIGVSLFIVPPNTRLWVWATSSVVCLAGFNFFLHRRLQKGTGERKTGFTTGIVIFVGALAILLELIIRSGIR